MNDLIIFNSPEFGEIRSTMIDGEPWLVGKDVATALGYQNPQRAIRDHVDDEDKGVTEMVTPGGKQELSIINESGLYSLIFSSKLPNAKAFKHWVTSEVLPSIRKTGFYGVRPLPTPADSVRAAELLLTAKGADRRKVIRILKQGGFDIDEGTHNPLPGGACVNLDDAGSEEMGIKAFLADILPRAAWTLLPFSFLYDLYRKWMAMNHPDTPLYGRNYFIKAIEPIVGNYGWIFPDRNAKGKPKATRSSPRMDKPEPLIIEYKCKNWYNPYYHGNNPNHIARPRLSEAYRGIYKMP